jgi:hypothetical protein
MQATLWNEPLAGCALFRPFAVFRIARATLDWALEFFAAVAVDVLRGDKFFEILSHDVGVGDYVERFSVESVQRLVIID